MVCKQERPDDRISVAHHKVPGMENLFPEARTNIRYCNDDPTCATLAHDEELWHFTSLKERP